MTRVGANLDVLIDVGRRRILDCHACRHQFRVLALSKAPSDRGELGAAVDTRDVGGVVHGHGFHDSSGLAMNGHEVGKVGPPLRVGRADAADRIEQPGQVEGIDACIDLRDGTHSRAGVFLLDNTCNLPAVPDDPAVSVRLGHVRGDHGGGCTGAPVRLNQLFQR